MARAWTGLRWWMAFGCAMLYGGMAGAVDTVTEPEKCLKRAAPYQLAFLEKENLLITVGGSGIYAYDATTGEQRWHRYLNSSSGYQGASLQKRRVLGWSEWGVFLLDAVTGKEVWWRRDSGVGEVHYAQLSRDGNQILTVGERSSVLYGIQDRSQKVLPAMPTFLGWFEDGRSMMFMTVDMVGDTNGGNGNRVRRWKILDIVTGAVTQCREEQDALDMAWPYFSSRGQFAQMTGGDGDRHTLQISNARTGAVVRELSDLGDTGRFAIWLQDGKRLFFTSADRKVARVIDADTGETLISLSGEGHRFGTPFEEDTETPWVFSTDAANNEYVWKLAPDGTPRKVLDGSRFSTEHFSFDRIMPWRLVTLDMQEDRFRIYAVYSLDGANKLAEWRCRTPKQLYREFKASKGLTHVCTCFPIKRENYGRPANMTFALYGRDSEDPVRTGPGSVLAISPDGRYLALQTDDRLACLYDAETNRVVGQYAPSEKGEGWSSMTATFSDDGKRMALNNSECVEVTSLSEDYPRRTLHSGDGRMWYTKLCFSPDGKRLLSGGQNRAWLFNTENGALLHTFDENERFAEMYQYQRGGFWESLANSAKDWAGMVTDRFKQGSQLEAVFSGDGNRIITHMSAQVIRVWDTQTGHLLHTIHTGLPERRTPRGEIRNSIVLSENGRFAFAYNGNGNGPAGLWSLEDGELVRKYRLPESTWLSGVPQDDGKAVFVINNWDLYRWPGAPGDPK